jgi:hypothetical protein
MSKGIHVLLIIIYIFILTASIFAYNSYPQGETYGTGNWVARDFGPDVPEYATSPSPARNPLWVGIIQNYGKFILTVCFIGLIISVVALTEKAR